MTEDNRSSGSDPIGDLQRWLMRSSARRMGKELKGQARRAFGGGPPERVDVWEAATADPLPDEAPECAWCPVCRAARRFRQSGPGLASHVAGAGDALLTVAQDTLAAFEATLSARPPATGHRPDHQARREPAAASPRGTGWPAEAETPAAADAEAPAADAGADAPAAPAGTIGSGEAVRSGGIPRPGEAAGSADAAGTRPTAGAWATATAGEADGSGDAAGTDETGEAAEGREA